MDAGSATCAVRVRAVRGIIVVYGGSGSGDGGGLGGGLGGGGGGGGDTPVARSFGKSNKIAWSPGDGIFPNFS